MLIFFDHGVPVPLRRHLIGRRIETAFERCWQELANGALLGAVESAGFELMITTDKNLRHQQDLSSRTLSVLILPTTSWPKLKLDVQRICAAVNAITRGSVVEL